MTVDWQFRATTSPCSLLMGSVQGFAMSLLEILPALSPLDKIRLIQILAQDLGRDDGVLIEPGLSYPVWSPERAFSAAAALLKALDEDKGLSSSEPFNPATRIR
jgi:hypothetical protein